MRHLIQVSKNRYIVMKHKADEANDVIDAYLKSLMTHRFLKSIGKEQCKTVNKQTVKECYS